VTLVVDTGVVLAAVDRADAAHARCAALLRGGERLTIPEPVLVELDYWCGVKRLVSEFDRVLGDVHGGRVELARVADADLVRVIDLRSTYRDLRVGYVDAAILAIVERLGERRLATLDHRHFSVMRPRHVDALELLPH
jgi:hypothetical protein